jgi:predicted HAD superfamily Cof-like phosphohydrolase
MKDALEKLKEFHRVFDCARRDTPGFPADETVILRVNLIDEEWEETKQAIFREDMEGIADGLADLCYVVIGTAVAYGIPLDRVFEEVHRANMEKALGCDHCAGRGRLNAYPTDPDWQNCPDCNGTGLVVLRRPDGKVLKPEGWRPPNIHAALYPSEE